MIIGFTVQWHNGKRTTISGTARRIDAGGNTWITTPHGPVVLLRGSHKLSWPVGDRDQREEEAE